MARMSLRVWQRSCKLLGLGVRHKTQEGRSFPLQPRGSQQRWVERGEYHLPPGERCQIGGGSVNKS